MRNRFYVPNGRGAAALDELGEIRRVLPTQRGVRVRIPGTAPGNYILKDIPSPAYWLADLWDDAPGYPVLPVEDVLDTEAAGERAAGESYAHVVPFLAAFVADPDFPLRDRVVAEIVTTLLAASRVQSSPFIEALSACASWIEEAARRNDLAGLACSMCLELLAEPADSSALEPPLRDLAARLAGPDY